MKKKVKPNYNFSKAVFSLVSMSIIIIAVGSYFIVSEKNTIGLAFLAMGFLNLIAIKLFKIKIKDIYSDLIFGFTDNAAMVFAAIIGGTYGGVVGAIIGGVAGNTIADGLSGFAEGYFIERQRQHKIYEKRNLLSIVLGKVTGCLFGAGVTLTIVWLIRSVL